MGLTIHYSLRLKGPRTTAQIRRLMKRLRATACDLPFQEVDPLVEYRPERGVPPSDFPCGLFHADGTQSFGKSTVERPLMSLVGFCIVLGPGSEPAEFALARYASQRNWSWYAFCKTQYASHPRLGGDENFLRCHLNLVRMLDRARELGIQVKVNDEGTYWEKRDRAQLIKELHEYNQWVAAFGGQLKDALGNGIEGPIFDFPNYEHLEAQGAERIPKLK